MSKRPPAVLPIKLDPNPSIEQALASLEKALGGRDSILGTLVQADLTDDEQYLVDQLASPENDAKSLAKVCGLARFKVGGFLELFKRAAGARAFALSMQKVYEHLPRVTEDVMERAVPQKARCGVCRGLGIVPALTADLEGNPILDENGKKQFHEEQCWPCEGTGQVIILPDLERQELALKIGGLLKEHKGPTLNVDLRNQAAILKTNADFRSATDQLLFGKRETSESPKVEVVDAEPTTEANE